MSDSNNKDRQPPPLPDSKEKKWREKRAYPRFNYVIEVSMHTAHEFFTGLTNDISEGGLFVNTYEILPIGEKLEVEIVLPGMKEPTTLLTEVVWIRPPVEMNDDIKVGMGLKLINPNTELQKAIRRYIKRHEPMFYEV